MLYINFDTSDFVNICEFFSATRALESYNYSNNENKKNASIVLICKLLWVKASS